MKVKGDDPTSISDALSNLFARIERLEKAAGLADSSFEDGPLTVYDSVTGIKRVEMGKLNNGKFGFRVYEPNGTTVYFEESDT